MAHAVHLTDEELTLLPSKGVSIAHCPASNTRLKSGLCPVRRIINANIIVGLGTGTNIFGSTNTLRSKPGAALQKKKMAPLYFVLFIILALHSNQVKKNIMEKLV